LLSNTVLMPGSFLSFSCVGSGSSAAAPLKNSMTWPTSTTGLAMFSISLLQNWW